SPMNGRLRAKGAAAFAEASADRPGLDGGWSAGPLSMSNGLTRLQTRFLHDAAKVDEILAHAGPFNAGEAEDAGLVTFAPDEIDWDDEVRVAVEARAAFSPDAMTGLEANLRFA